MFSWLSNETWKQNKRLKMSYLEISCVSCSFNFIEWFQYSNFEYWKNVTEEYPTLLEKGKYKARLIISNHWLTATKPVSMSSDLQDLLSATTTLPQAIFNYFNLKEQANYIIKLGLGILQGCKQSVHPRLPSLINLEGKFVLIPFYDIACFYHKWSGPKHMANLSNR